MSLEGPHGRRHEAPGVHAHQFIGLFMSTGPGGLLKVIEPGTSRAGSAPGYMAGSGAFSATVMYPVASTNSEKSELVTAVSSIQKPPTSTSSTGFSSG